MDSITVSTQLLAAALTVVASAFGGLAGLALWLAKRDRATAEARVTENRAEAEKVIAAQWKRVDELRDTLASTRRDVDRLAERIDHFPDFQELNNHLQSQVQRLEEKLERKLDSMASRLEKAMDKISASYTCRALDGDRTN